MFDDCGPEAAHGRVASHAGPNDSTPDHKNVEIGGVKLFDDFITVAHDFA
jgi:hypothetical protein